MLSEILFGGVELCFDIGGTPEDCADKPEADEVTCLLVGVKVILPKDDFNVPFDNVVVELVFAVAVKEAFDLTPPKLTLALAIVFSFCNFESEIFVSFANTGDTFGSLPFILPSTGLILGGFTRFLSVIISF